MAGRGAPVGNQNGAKGKQFLEAMRKALAKSGGTVDKGVVKVAEKLVSAALDGEQWAIQEIGNRLDGKPAQALIHQGDDEAPLIMRIERVIADPGNTDS